ncbi:putative endonuclease-reverse transcriptase [Trichonephila clavipes]|uniref:Putative endonuclease-reverse transcriptase n=1 Tax=Trichonephila clavipes TaxID=2585209 RepID=A0A8X6WIR8_TRICX|nr:putative endonuclease-reverse transcriptase [Trichonephila clavipes]
MNEDRTTKRVFNAQPNGTRKKGRSNLRWIDGIEKDLLALRTKNWRTLAGRRLAWKRLLEKAWAVEPLRKECRLLLYKSLIRSVLTYASEIRSLTLRDEEALGIFDRKILLCILGGILVKGSWRSSNLELYKIYKQPDIVKFDKLQRLKWVGHLSKMNEDHCCNKIFLAKLMVNRPRGRTLLR